MNLTNLGLLVILITALTFPFLSKKVEESLEFFIFILGCAALTLTQQWSPEIIREALVEPIKITLAVFFAGFLFKLMQKPLAHNVNRIMLAIGRRWFIFWVIVILGIASSIITAIIAALILVEIINYIKLDRKTEIKIVVLACFSIGLGAALTPIGEPLSTIVIAKLKGMPYQAGFFFLLKELGYYLIPGVLIFGVIGVLMSKPTLAKEARLSETKAESNKDILIRTGKVYLFVMALIFLGTGFKPAILAFISKIPHTALYWMNVVSAILDNATLAAAEIGPSMQPAQIKSALLGLLIAGGMLIPGNIPNIISAGKLKIKSSEWVKIGVPLGLIVMVVTFALLLAHY